MDAPSRPRAQPASRVGLASALLAGSITVLYLVIIVSQGDADVVSVAVVATSFAALAAAAAIGSTRPSAAERLPWLGASTGGLIGLGVISLITIGLLLLVAGALSAMAWGAATRSTGAGHRRERALATALSVVVPVLLLAAILVT